MAPPASRAPLLSEAATTVKKYPKLVQADKRGQIVIPKDVRNELGIDETTGFYVYVIPGEGVLLKQVEPEPLDESDASKELKKHAKEIGLDEAKLQEAEQNYQHSKGGLQDL